MQLCQGNQVIRQNIETFLRVFIKCNNEKLSRRSEVARIEVIKLQRFGLMTGFYYINQRIQMERNDYYYYYSRVRHLPANSNVGVFMLMFSAVYIQFSFSSDWM